MTRYQGLMSNKPRYQGPLHFTDKAVWAQCSVCHKWVRLTKPIVGSLHLCDPSQPFLVKKEKPR